MIFGVGISIPGLTRDELSYLVQKHACDFDVSVLDIYGRIDNSIYVKLKGEENLVNMLDFLGSNGYQVELISAKNE